MLTAQIRNSTAFLSRDTSTSLRVRGEIILPDMPLADDVRLNVVVRDQTGRILKADYNYLRLHAVRDGVLPFEESIYVDDDFQSLELEMYAEIRVAVHTDTCRASLSGDGTVDFTGPPPSKVPFQAERPEPATTVVEPEPATPSRSLHAGDQLGRYRIRVKVCDWDHGAIYVGDHRNLNKTVLIKVTDNEGPGRDVLASEAQRMVQRFSQHVAVDDLGSEQGLSYLLVSIGVQDLVQKASNTDLLENLATEPIARMLEVSMDSARALVAAVLSPWRPV